MSRAAEPSTLPTQGVVFGQLVVGSTAIAVVHAFVLLLVDVGRVEAPQTFVSALFLVVGPAVATQIFALVTVIRASLLRRAALRMRDDTEAPPPSRSTLADALAAGRRARLVFMCVTGVALAVPWMAAVGATMPDRIATVFLQVGAALGAALATDAAFSRALGPWIKAFPPQEIEQLATSARQRVELVTRAVLGVLAAELVVTGFACAAFSVQVAPLLLALCTAVAAAAYVGVVVARAEARRERAINALLDRMKRLAEGAGVELVQETGETLGDGLAATSVLDLATAIAACMHGVSVGVVAEQTAKRSLEEIQRTKTLFVASMSHDLRSPLNSILGFSELLLQGIGGQLDDGQVENVLVVQRSGTELLELLNDIIDSARFESGRMPLHLAWTPTVEILTEAVARGREMVVARSGGRRFQIEPHIEPGLPPLRVDRERIVQAVVCLFRHATEAMDGGVIGIEARRVEGESGAAVRVDVATGGAIREEDRERLFLAFRAISSPTGKRIGGLGLSLTLARSLVRAHGGDISYTSRGSNASLSVTLPLT